MIHFVISNDIHLFSNAFEQLNICFRNSMSETIIVNKILTIHVLLSKMLKNSLPNQLNAQKISPIIHEFEQRQQTVKQSTK